MFPIVAVILSTMNHYTDKYQKAMLDAYSQSGTMAEETLSAMKTVHAFNAQGKMSDMYSTHVLVAKRLGYRKAVVAALGFGLTLATFH